MSRLKIALCVVAVSACLPEIRVGPKEGIAPVSGVTEIATNDFVCGAPISAGGAAVSSRVVPEGCELTLSDEVQVLDEPDYAQISDSTSFSGLLEAVELNLTQFALVDAQANAPLDLQTQVSSARMSINGQWLADKGTLTSLPQVLRLAGPALQPVKDAITQKAPVSLKLEAVVVFPQSVLLPQTLRFEYQAQPTLVLGGSI